MTKKYCRTAWEGRPTSWVTCSLSHTQSLTWRAPLALRASCRCVCIHLAREARRTCSWFAGGRFGGGHHSFVGAHAFGCRFHRQVFGDRMTLYLPGMAPSLGLDRRKRKDTLFVGRASGLPSFALRYEGDRGTGQWRTVQQDLSLDRHHT